MNEKTKQGYVFVARPPKETLIALQHKRKLVLAENELKLKNVDYEIQDLITRFKSPWRLKIKENDVNEKITEISNHLEKISKQGEQKNVGLEELFHKWASGEVPAMTVITILQQNGVLQELQVAAIAFSLGIKPIVAEAGTVDFAQGKQDAEES